MIDDVIVGIPAEGVVMTQGPGWLPPRISGKRHVMPGPHGLHLTWSPSERMATTTSIIPASATITYNHDHSGASSDEHLVGLWLSQKSPNTRAAYMADTARFMVHLRVRGLGMRQATLADIQEYVDTIEGAPATKARRVSSMKSLLSFAYRTGYVAFNVGKAIAVPKVPNDLAERILTEEQVIRMISVAKPGRDQVLIRLLYVSGLRLSEVEGLRWKHVHLGDDEARLTVHGKGGKTRHILLTPTVTTFCVGGPKRA